MRVILNSDVLVSLSFLRGAVPHPVGELCSTCSQKGVVITVPETALLEFERFHRDLIPKRINALQEACDLLTQYSVQFDPVDPTQVVKPPDLIGMLKATGAVVEVSHPTREIFAEAHRRACLHLSPSNPEAKSDEMRDLIIWLTAIALAEQERGTILIAQDKLFHHARGDDEATRVELKRVRDISDALGQLRLVESPLEAVAFPLLRAIWPDFVSAGLPLPTEPPEHFSLSRSVLVNDGDGTLSLAAFELAIPTSDGDPLQASIRVNLTPSRITSFELSNIRVGNDSWEPEQLRVQIDRPFTSTQKDYSDPLRMLRDVIGGRDET